MIRRTRRLVIRTLEVLIVFGVIIVSASYIYFRYYKETTFRYARPLSEDITSIINNSIGQEPIVNGIQVVKVDLNNNVRYVVHSYFKNSELSKIYDKFAKSRITAEIPVFSKDDVENARLIRMMNHKVDCVPFNQTLSYKLSPEAAKFVKAVCTISIPPAFNEFKGIIALSLDKLPDEKEKEHIDTLLTDLSNTVYPHVK